MTTVTDDGRAPGRKRMRRANGRVDVYWVASPEAIRAGYKPKTIPLKNDPGHEVAPPEIAAFCRSCWAEMLEFLTGAQTVSNGAPLGTIGWLCDLYETDPDSTFHGKRSATQVSYSRSIQIIRETVGEKRIANITANDVRKWFKRWGRAGEDGRLENPRRAYGCVQLLRIAVKYGKGQRFAGCRELSEILTDTEFPVPRGRRIAMTEAQALAIIKKAKERGLSSIARAVAIQFCTALRQKDVIGEWVDDRWESGLLWGAHIKSDWTLEKPTSKSNFQEIAEFDLKLHPPAFAELQAVPATSRIGPVILDERYGLPFRQRRFAELFREVARAAGVPDEVWNMDSRAGAITDARKRGATREDAMHTGTHLNEATNRKYDRARLDATNRVAELRFGRRETRKEPS